MNCNEGQHLIGATQKCLMCHCPANCPECGKLHGYSEPVRREAIRFLTQVAAIQGAITVCHYKKNMISTMAWMVALMLQENSAEVPPTIEELECYTDRWIDYVRKQNGNSDVVESEA